MHDQEYMLRAMELAQRARGRTNPNPMVGCVIVKDGKIVGEGYHQKAGTPHAEVHALKAAGELAKGATMYVTLEPCSHYGRTPPCALAVVEAGLQRVVVAMEDPNPKVAGRGIDILKHAGIQVEVGLLEAEAYRMNEVFLKYITAKQPFILFKGAMTLDGKTATATGHSRWITDSSAREYVHKLRDEYDAIMVGIGTVLADDPALTTRLDQAKLGRETRDPIRVIVDTQGQTPLNARVLAVESAAPTWIFVGNTAPPDRIAALRAKAEVIVLPTNAGHIDLRALCTELGKREVSSVLLEGGATLAGAFLDAQLIDRVAVFIAPKIVGGATAPTLLKGMGVDNMEQAVTLHGPTLTQFGNDWCIEAALHYSTGKDGKLCLPDSQKS